MYFDSLVFASVFVLIYGTAIISNGLDVDTMKLLENKIKKFQKNSTIILTGHQFSFYQHVADNVFVKKDTELKQIDYDKLKNNSLENIYNEEIN